jgi:serine/threonine-protein kinase HipA
MVDILKTIHNQKEIGEIILNIENGDFELRYKPEVSVKNSICLTLPSTNLTYFERNFRLPTYFDMFIPEGYLFEFFKNFIAKKEGKVNDQIIFSYLANGIDGRMKFKGNKEVKILKEIPSIQEVIKNDTVDFFNYLVNIFLYKNSISGIQPKTAAVLKDKGFVGLGNYIIKTYGKEYPYLTVNEFICLNILKKSGVKTCDYKLSENGNFLIVKRFDNSFTGFEEVCSLLGKRKDEKYNGSYEKVVKVITELSTNYHKDCEDLFKTILINYIVGNGDAHLKNFGVIFNDDFSDIRISPFYDIVSTVVYISNDIPALTMYGKKSWNEWKDIKRFGNERCMISEIKVNMIIKEIIDVVYDSLNEIDYYSKKFKSFKVFGERMKKFILNSLEGLKKEV